MAKVYERLQEALRQFTECPGWRVFLHDMDCTDPDDEGQHPDDSQCKCDGPYRIKQVEEALAIEFSLKAKHIPASPTANELGCAKRFCRSFWTEVRPNTGKSYSIGNALSTPWGRKKAPICNG